MQVQVHVEQLPVEGFVDLLFPLRSTRLLHGPLHARPVQVSRQVSQENTHMLHVVQADAELAESQEEQKRRKRGVVEEIKKKEKKQSYQEVERWLMSINNS